MEWLSEDLISSSREFRDEHGSGLDRTGSGLKPILAGQDWIGQQFFSKLADQDWIGLRNFLLF